MSSSLSGSRPYLLDLELVKSPLTSARASQSSSPSSTISESATSPFAISTRKPRAARKRPNQTYNEAAALLSTAYPTIFSAKQISKPRKFHSNSRFVGESSELLLPLGAFDSSVFLLHQPMESFTEYRATNLTSPSSCSTSTTIATWNGSEVDSTEVCGGVGEDLTDFVPESMLDDETNEGINSVLGNTSVSDDWLDDGSIISWTNSSRNHGIWGPGPIGLSLGGRNPFGVRPAVARALRRNNFSNFLNFPVVDVLEISPNTRHTSHSSPYATSKSNSNLSSNSKSNSKSAQIKNSTIEKKKKRKTKKVQKLVSEGESESPEEKLSLDAMNSALNLNLNYDDVLTAWSDSGMPFPDDVPGAEGADVLVLHGLKVAEVPSGDILTRQLSLFSTGESSADTSLLR